MPRQALPNEETVKRYLDEPSDSDPEGTWVTFRKDLEWGDQKALALAMFNSLSATDIDRLVEANDASALSVDVAAASFTKAAVYVDDWNLIGPNGTKLRLPRERRQRIEIMQGLSADIGAWIEAQINLITAEQQEINGPALEGIRNGQEEAEDEELSPLALPAVRPTRTRRS